VSSARTVGTGPGSPWLVGAVAIAAGSLLPAWGCRGGSRGAENPGALVPATAGGGAGFQGMAQDFQLDDIAGRPFRLSDYHGKSVVVLDFWATWCDPCKVELPRLAEIYERLRGRGLTIAAISIDGPESVAQVRGVARQLRLPFPVLLDQESRVVALYNPRYSAPYAVIIDRDGRVVRQHEGYTPGDENGLARELEGLLGP
jgi:peroxiredoxin